MFFSIRCEEMKQLQGEQTRMEQQEQVRLNGRSLARILWIFRLHVKEVGEM